MEAETQRRGVREECSALVEQHVQRPWGGEHKEAGAALACLQGDCEDGQFMQGVRNHCKDEFEFFSAL